MTCSWNWSSGASSSAPASERHIRGITTDGRNGQKVHAANPASDAVGSANSMYWYPNADASSGTPPGIRSTGSNTGQETQGDPNSPVDRPSSTPTGARSEKTISGWSW